MTADSRKLRKTFEALQGDRKKMRAAADDERRKALDEMQVVWEQIAVALDARTVLEKNATALREQLREQRARLDAAHRGIALEVSTRVKGSPALAGEFVPMRPRWQLFWRRVGRAVGRVVRR